MIVAAEDGRARIKGAPRRGGFWGSPWAGAAGLAGAIALLALVWSLRPRDPAPARVDFPQPPQIDAALAEVEARLRDNGEDLPAMVELGVLHFKKGQALYPEAINELEEARELGALDPRIFYCLGIMYQDLGLYGHAMKEYRRYLRNHPREKEIRMLLGKLLYQEGRFHEAVSEFERLKFHHPKDRLVEENLGLSLWGAKLLDRAADSFGNLKAMGGDESARAGLYLGQVAFERGDYRGALEHLESALAGSAAPPAGIPPERLQAALAMTYRKLDMPEKSREAWERVLDISPKDPKAQAALKELRRLHPPKAGAKGAPDKRRR